MDKEFATKIARYYIRFGDIPVYDIYQLLLELNTNSRKEFDEKNTGAKMGFNPVSPIYKVLAMGEWNYLKARATGVNVLPYATIYLIHPDRDFIAGAYQSDYVYDAFIEVDGTEYILDCLIDPANDKNVERILLALDGYMKNYAFLHNQVPLLRNVYIVDRGIPKDGCIQMASLFSKKFPRRYINDAKENNIRHRNNDIIMRFNANLSNFHRSFGYSMSKTIDVREFMDMMDTRDRFFDIKCVNIAYSIACSYLRLVQTGVELIDRCNGSDSLIGIGQFGNAQFES